MSAHTCARLSRKLIVFDMDGVLAEVTESYREAIVQTVEHFTGRRIDARFDPGLQEPGRLEQRLGAFAEDRRGSGRRRSTYNTVVDHFNEIFIGENGRRLDPARAVVPASPDCSNACASVSAWRSSPAACDTKPKSRSSDSRRIVRSIRSLCAEHVAEAKPAPDGLLAIQRRNPGRKLWYVGDTVDDARSARAAGVPFIGIAAQNHSRRR